VTGKVELLDRGIKNRRNEKDHPAVVSFLAFRVRDEAAQAANEETTYACAQIQASSS
jgi:hypothetical protein